MPLRLPPEWMKNDPRFLSEEEWAKKYAAAGVIDVGNHALFKPEQFAGKVQQPAGQTPGLPTPAQAASSPRRDADYGILAGLLGTGYTIETGSITPGGPVEHIVVNRATGQVLPIQLRQEAQGAFGGIFSGWQSASGQRLTALETLTATRDKEGMFTYHASSSMENIGKLILEAEQARQGNFGETWVQALNRITTKAENARATYTPWNVSQEAEQTYVRRIPFIAQGEGGEPLPPWERRQAGALVQSRIDQALPTRIGLANERRYSDIQKLVLKPNQEAFVPYAIRQEGDIRIGPAGAIGREEMSATKISKGQTIQTQAVPRALEAEKFGRVWRLTQPAPVLSGPQVGPVESNVGIGDIGEKLYAAVMDIWPGGALKIPNKDVRQTGYFIPGVERAEFKGESIQSVLKNLVLPKELVGREVFPGQRRASPIRWRTTEGEQEVPLSETVIGRTREEIPVESSMRHGTVTGARGRIPAFVYTEGPMKGMVAPPPMEIFRRNLEAPGKEIPIPVESGIRSTEPELALFQKAFPQLPWERSLTAQNVSVEEQVFREVSQRPRGFIKAGEMEVENAQIRATVGRKEIDLPINFVTGEFKSAGVIRKIFGAQTPENIKGIFGEWAGLEGTEAAQKLATYVGGISPDPTGRMRLDPNALRSKYLEFGGQLEGTGNDLLRQVWGGVMYGVDTSTREGRAKNIEHLQRYGAGLADLDITMPMAKSTRQFREQEAMAAVKLLPGNEGLSDDEVRKIVRRQMTPVTLESGEPGIRMRGKNVPVMPLIATNAASFIGGARANEQLIRALSATVPGWAQKMGLLATEMPEATGMKAAWTEARSFYMAEISRRRGEEYTPPGATEVSQGQAQQALSVITSMQGAEPKDILGEINKILNPETGEPTGLLHGAGRTMIGTRTAAALDYEGPTGKSVGGFTKRYLGAISGFLGGIAAGPGGKVEPGGDYDKLVSEVGGLIANKPIFKQIHSRDIAAGAYSGFVTAPGIPTNALYVPPKLRDFMLRQMGFEGKGLRTARKDFEQFVESGKLQALGVRMPQHAGEAALGFFNLISKKAAGIGRIASNKFNFFTSEAFAKLGIGDQDIDAMITMLGMQRNAETNKLEFIKDKGFEQRVQGFTNKYIDEQNQKVFEDPALRNQTNATLQMFLGKYGAEKNPMLELFGKAGDVPQEEISKEMAGRALSKENVGAPFNMELRLQQAVMATSGGFPEEFIQGPGTQTAAGRYQGILDDLFRGIQRGGANVTQLVSGARLLKEGKNAGMLELAMRTPEGEKWHTMRLDPRKVGKDITNWQNSLPALMDTFIKKIMMPTKGPKGEVYQPMGDVALALGISSSKEEFTRNLEALGVPPEVAELKKQYQATMLPGTDVLDPTKIKEEGRIRHLLEDANVQKRQRAKQGIDLPPTVKAEIAQRILREKSPQALAQTNFAVQIMTAAMAKLDPDTAAAFLGSLPKEVKERVEATTTLYRVSTPGGTKRLGGEDVARLRDYPNLAPETRERLIAEYKGQIPEESRAAPAAQVPSEERTAYLGGAVPPGQPPGQPPRPPAPPSGGEPPDDRPYRDRVGGPRGYTTPESAEMTVEKAASWLTGRGNDVILQHKRLLGILGELGIPARTEGGEAIPTYARFGRALRDQRGELLKRIQPYGRILTEVSQKWGLVNRAANLAERVNPPADIQELLGRVNMPGDPLGGALKDMRFLAGVLPATAGNISQSAIEQAQTLAADPRLGLLSAAITASREAAGGQFQVGDYSKTLKSIFAAAPSLQPIAAEAAKVARAIPVGQRGDLVPASVLGVADVVAGAQREGMRLSTGGRGAGEQIQLPMEATKRYIDLLAKQDAMLVKASGSIENMTKAEEKRFVTVEKQLQLEDIRGQKMVASGVLAEYRAQRATGIVSEDILTRAPRAARALGQLGAQEAELQEDIAGTPQLFRGSFLRRVLGGWGMMYMARIAGMITGSLGQGQQEALAMQDTFAGAAAQAGGRAYVPYNQLRAAQNITALYGAQINPLTTGKMMMAQNPLLSDVYSTGVAGLGAYAITQQFGQWAGEGTGMMGFAKGPGAIALAVGVGTASLIAQTYQKMQSPEGVGLQMSKLGANLQRTGAMGGGPLSGSISAALTVFSSTGLAAALGGPEQAKATREWKNLRLAQLTAPYGTAASAIGAVPGTTEYAVGLTRLQTLAQEQRPDLSPEAVAKAYTLISNQNLPQNYWQRYAEQYQQGMQPGELAAGLLAASGMGAGAFAAAPPQSFWQRQGNQMQPVPGVAATAQGALADYISRNYPLPNQQAQLGLGGNYIGGFGTAAAWLPGNVTSAKQLQTDEAIKKYLASVAGYGLLEGKPAGDVYKAQYTAWLAQRTRGMPVGPAPSISPYISGGEAAFMQPEEAARQTAMFNAQAVAANVGINIGAQLQQQAYTFGRPALGNQMYNLFTSGAIPQGQEQFYGRLFNAEPLAMAVQAGRGRLTPALAAQTFPTMTGQALNFQQYTGQVDVNMQTGMPTGLAYGTTSLANVQNIPAGSTPQQIQALTQASAEAAAKRIYGENWKQTSGLAAPSIQKMISGQPLPSGQMVYGQQSLQYDQIMNSYNASIASAGTAMKGVALSMAFTTGVGLNKYAGTINPQTGQPFGALYQGGTWGLQDAQRALGYQQQEWQFGFQQRGMNLGAQQFQENMALNQRGTQMQRGWTKQDWGYQTQTRELQWGWRQEDYAENIRFMTGRERKLAERQMGRETIMHDIEGEQIEKQKSRQKELWRLEDQRFALQNKQFVENLKMQQEQLDKSIEYYKQNKELQEEQVKLERAQYIQQMALQKESAGLQAHYAELAKANAIQQLEWQMDQARQQGELNLLEADFFMRWDAALTKWLQLLGGVPGGGGDGGCFIAGTPVTLADYSTKPIEEVEIGEYVLSYDTSSKKFVYAKVCNVFHHMDCPDPYYLLINGYLGVTPEHLMLINGAWRSTDSLSIGDILFGQDGAPIVVESIQQINYAVPVYNLHTEDRTHDYFAGGILVHNVKAEAAGGFLWGAAGGMARAVEVGEQGTEGIVGGRVIPHSEWESMKRIHDLFQRPVGVTIAGGSSYIPMGGKKAGAPQTINIFIGNEKLSSFVLDAVTKELRS